MITAEQVALDHLRLWPRMPQDWRERWHDAAVGVLRHPKRIRQFHPFDGIDIHGQIPGVNRLWIDTQHEGEQPGDHQSLNMVGIAITQGLLNRILQTRHVRLTAPVEGWQRPTRLQCIAFKVFGHEVPIDPAHVLAPAQHLSNETFSSSERHGVLMERSLDTCDDGLRINQFEIKCHREPRVPQPRLTLPYRILIGAKQGPSVADEILQCRISLRRRQWPVEILQTPRMIGVARSDLLQNLSRQSVRLE